jgi:ribosomal protein S18 acetylase RimI-like enzyme
MTKSDLKALAGMDAKLFGDTTETQGLKVYRDCFRKRIAGACLVAEEGREAIGAIFAERKLGFLPNFAHISSLFVKKEWQRKGVGKLLLEKCFATMKKQGIENVSLTVSQKNHAALSFYKKYGFKLSRLLYTKKL